MKKVINNSVYDTEKASKLGYDQEGYPNDFAHFRETLFRTRAGKYFLHGEGGPNSRYGVWQGNSGSGSEKIMPMSLDEARQWAEEHLDGDEYIKVFGDPGDGEKTLKGVYLSTAACNQLEQLQAEKGMSMSAVVESLILGTRNDG